MGAIRPAMMASWRRGRCRPRSNQSSAGLKRPRRSRRSSSILSTIPPGSCSRVRCTMSGTGPGFGPGSSERYVSSSALTISISSVWRLNSSFPIHSSVMSSVTTGLFGSGDMRVEPAAARHRDSSALDPYRPWLMAAAIYNLVAGAAVVFAPTLYFRIVHIPPPNYLPLWQVVGMFVLVYSPGYWWASRDPVAHSHLVLIGLLGKILGPIGFAWSAWTGQLPMVFGVILITND